MSSKGITVALRANAENPDLPAAIKALGRPGQ
jgi:hypothetical protein